MIELSVIDAFYLVLTFFSIILGTLLTLVLFRVLKILAVGVELANYYWNMKKVFQYYAYVPFALKDSFFQYISSFTRKSKSSDEGEKKSEI